MRATVKIEGYVNVPGRESRPILTPDGVVVETIQQGVFKRALAKADKVVMLVDHMHDPVADTETGNLTLTEDDIGLKLNAEIDNPEIEAALAAGKARGWSFGMKHVKRDLSDGEKYPKRTITDMDLKEVSLILNSNPAYAATSIECRSTGDEETEYRAETSDVLTNTVPQPVQTEKPDLTTYYDRLKKMED